MIVKQPKHIDCLAVDADIVCFRIAAVMEMSSLGHLHEAIDEYIFNMSRDTGIKKFAMFISDETNFRYRIAKTKRYKGNRYDKNGNPKIPKPYNLVAAKQYIMDKYQGYIAIDYEADDAIASFMTLHPNVAHAGIDKDIRATYGYHYHIVNKEWEYTDQEDAVLMLHRQICTGDRDDNIGGLEGIGPVKAAEAVVNPVRAKEEAFALYCVRLAGKSEDFILEYFEEQTALITMVDSIDIPYSTVIEIIPPLEVEPDLEDEEPFMGFENTLDI